MRWLLAVPLLLLAACSSDPDLDGKTFTSTEVTGHELVEGTTVQLTFEDGTMRVDAGCNTAGADYELDDGTLAWVGNAASSLVGCPDDLAEQDVWLHQLFADGVDAELDGSTLTLTTGDVEMVLEAG